jgi:head-tail adaptor
MLTSGELSFMRDSIEQLLPDTCSILSVTYTSDGAGGLTEAWGATKTLVPCRVDYLSGREAVSGGALIPYQKAIVSMAYDETITPANRILVGSNTFSIQAVNTAQSWQAVTRCSCELVP